MIQISCSRSLWLLAAVAMGLLVTKIPIANGSWRQALQLHRPDDATSGPESRYALRPVGLRRIQRRPELIDPLDNELSSTRDDSSFEPSNILTRAARELLQQSYNERLYEKRSSTKQLDKTSSETPQMEPNEFIYVVAPFSGQALPFQQSIIDQGYKKLVALSGPNYKIGLQRLADSSLKAGDRTDVGFRSLDGLSSAGCRATKSSVRVTRDEFDSNTGQLLRQCAGLVELNSCEGECMSSIQPSVKAAGGFAKKCSCCNEGSLRRVQVRLNECWLATPEAPMGARQAAGHMDVQVDEPADCKCRPCDTLI